MWGLPIMFWALLASFALSALLAIGWIAALDVELARRGDRAGKLPTITALPKAVAIPTAHRRRFWS